MNFRHKTMLIMMAMAAFTLLVASCAKNTTGTPPPSGATGVHLKIPRIKVKIGNATTLTISEGGSKKCNNNINAKGCIAATKGNTAEVTFELLGNVAWYFTEFEICRGVEASKKAHELACDLSQAERDDFEFSFNSGSSIKPDEFGIVDLRSLATDMRQFKLTDNNIVVQEYFYSVKACHMVDDDEKCKFTDPPIRNKGK